MAVSNDSGGNLDFRNRAASAQPLGALMQDNVFMGNQIGTTKLLLTLGNLPAATYSMTTYHHESTSAIDDLGNIEVDTGSGFTVAVAGPLATTTGTAAEDPFASYTFEFTANGSDDVVIAINKGVTAPAFTNGFSIESFIDDTLSITSYDYDAVAGEFTITWASRVGAFYRLHWSNAMTFWVEDVDSYPGGGAVSEETSYTFTGIPIGSPTRFFRVEEQ